MKNLNIIFLLPFFFVSLLSFGQEHYVEGLQGNDISHQTASVFDRVITIEDQYYQCANSTTTTCPFPNIITDTKLFVKLWFDDALRVYYGNEWEVEVTYDIDLYINSSTFITKTGEIRTISFHPNDGYTDVDIMEYQDPLGNQYTKAVLKVIDVKINFPPSTIHPFGVNYDLAKDIHLDLNLEVERLYFFDPNVTPQIHRSTNYDFNPATNEVTITWPYVHGAKESEFEWLFIDMGNDPKTADFDLNFKNATRISTKKNFYTISLAYPRGFLIFRVRSIGLIPSDPITAPHVFDRRVEGKWSVSGKTKYKLKNNKLVESSTGNNWIFDFYFWKGLEPDKNWQYNVVYAEEGKKKEIIQFFDDILKPDQTVTVLNTDNNAVVAQNITDYVGRNSLQILPAPQPSQGMRYYNPLHKNASGNNYSYLDFDTDKKIATNTIESLSSQNNLGAGFYYSNANTNPIGINGSYIPDAKGYPFSRTTYNNDGSGRVKEITGVGAEYHTGAERHKTKFLYSSPIQEVLFHLFGNEVGYAKYYEKTTAIDANGQASAAYKDLSGRVIATSLVGDAPDNLLDIDTKPDRYETMTTNLSHLNEQFNETLTVNKTISVVGSSIYYFKYSIPSAMFDNCGLSTPCVYDLKIYILDEYGNKIKINYNKNDVFEIVENAIVKIKSQTPIKFNANLTTGSYQIIKELTVNNTAIDELMDDFMLNQTCYKPEPWDRISTCKPTCDDICDNAYLSYPDNNGIQYYLSIDDGHRVAKLINGVLQTPYIDATGYQEVLDNIQACKAECNNVEPIFNECDLKYELLKQDMSPGGQYFDNMPTYYLADGVTLNTSYDKNGWLKSVNSKFQSIRSCFNKYYNSNLDVFWNNIRNDWKPEYADALIVLHPEWCAFETLCCGISNCGGTDYLVTTSFTYQDNCFTLTPAEISTIDSVILGIKNSPDNFNVLSLKALAELNDSGITDSTILAQFSPTALEDNVRNFYYEYFRYQRVKESHCNNPNLYLNSPNNNGITATGFQIRYPQNELFENFDPKDPNALQSYISNEGCKKAAEQAADDFINKLKAKCDQLSDIQEKQYWNHVYDEFLRDCQDPAVTVDLNQSIIDFNTCNAQLDEACFFEALPNQNDTLCACNKINDFVYDIIITNGNTTPLPTFSDVISNRASPYDANVQAALDVYLQGNDSLLKPQFVKWFKYCNDTSYSSWAGPNPSPPYKLAKFFKCDQDSIEQTECDTCCANTINAYTKAISEINFANLLKLKAQDYRQAYIDHCLENGKQNEIFEMEYTFNEYHWTLYYYDQAADLVKTIPPEGLFQKDPQGSTVYHSSLLRKPEREKAWDYLIGKTGSTYQHPAHLMITNYQYNSLQNVTTQKTPDGGVSEFWYDGLGRLAVSQNAYQKGLNAIDSKNTYSYTSYDELGRTVEAGELKHNDVMTKAKAEDIIDYNKPAGNNKLLVWLNTRDETTERTHSFYDEVSTISGSAMASGLQNNLRNRISAVAYDKDGYLQGNPSSYEAMTHYSYDILGNVKTLWQENTEIPLPNHRIKQLDYSYDLVSGNVNQVTYQKGVADQFIHKYTYDADNRLTKVQTSTDDFIYETDARYFYYAHGPLAREEIGDQIVFANDYIFDIRGWMTAMNSSVVDAERDAGKDGIAGGLNENIGRDPFAFSLQYFKGHYQPILASNSSVIATSFASIPTSDSKALYNGNIAKMVTSLKDIEQKAIAVMANAYRYDQLNRIKSFKPYWDNNPTSTTTPFKTNSFDQATNVGNYYNCNYWFDGNGNIERLKRNGALTATGDYTNMDDMLYGYNRTTAPTHPKVNNQLFFVNDRETTTGYDADIESGQTTNNYQYDAIGRLIKDKQEKIDKITWNVSNKVTSFMQSDANADVIFTYGPMGNRIGKLVKAKDQSTLVYDPTKEVKTYYMLDAQGNPMAIYKYDVSTNTLTLEDFILYGNKRLGTNTQKIQMN